MNRLALASALAIALGGCHDAPSTSELSPAAIPEPLVFERYSPAQHTSRDVFLAARGDVVVLAGRISRDRGVTWEPSPLVGADRVAIHETQLVAYVPGRGLVRYDLAARTVTPIGGVPTYASPTTWRLLPSGRVLVFDPIANAITVEGQSGAWTASQLPQHNPTEAAPYIRDVVTSGQAWLAISAWGLHRSSDGVTWERIAAFAPDMGRELLALADGQFVLLGGTRTYRFDAAGAIRSDAQPDDEVGPAIDPESASACEDGSILAGAQVSRDGGRQWQPLLAGGDLTLVVERVGCGGGHYWVLGHSSAWGYRLLRYAMSAGAAAPGIAAGNWEASTPSTWSSVGPPIVRTSDGTLIAAGLGWRDGDPAWSLRLVPARAWSAGATLFGVASGQFYTSDDGGHTWRATPASGLPSTEIEAFARSPLDGALYTSQYTATQEGGTDRWSAKVWRSTDGGQTWQTAYDASAMRDADGEITGQAHRFVGIANDGAWIAADAISHDGGVTWTPTEYDGDRSLAFVTPDGYLVTPRDDVWRVFEAGGAGELRGTWELEADGQPVPASQLRSVAFDEAGHAYVARGTPYVQVWRSTRPLVR